MLIRLVNLVEIYKILAKEYLQMERYDFQVENMSKNYYAYDVVNPGKLAAPLRLLRIVRAD